MVQSQDNEERRIQITRAIDRNGFDWQVWAVAASGFFTDSYNLFATNVILPSLAFVYWTDVPENNYESYINIATLVGSLIGQVLFGFLADRYGRRKLYGLELIVVIVATIGVAQSSSGYVANNEASMNILGWIMFWRILVGVGIGAEYPLSATITAE
jgi:PHS family inorganic phosphate transporter-like MFS transporter